MKISKQRLLLLITLVMLPMLAQFRMPGFVSAADVPPLVDLNGDAPGSNYNATFTEDEVAEPIVSVTGLTISNGEDLILTAAKAVLTNRLDGAVESLSAEAGATGLIVKYAADTGELTVKGSGSIEVYQQVLRTLVYTNTSQSPDISDRIILVTVSDGPQVSQPVTSTVAINAVNDAPVLDNSGNMMLMAINEDDQNSNGNSVSTIIKSAETEGQDRITDVDKNSLEGFAVIEASAANGIWQYSLNSGISWLPFELVSNTSAVLLNDAARIRFVPNPNFNGSANLLFRAWDQSGGRPSGTKDVDVSQNGGSTPFSSDSEMVTINIMAVNDLPVVDLNGIEAGLNFSVQFFESGPPVPIADQSATIVDGDHPSLAKLTITLTNRPNGAAESLIATGIGNISVTPYDSTTGILILNGPDSADNFQLALRQITYANTSTSPATAPRTLTVIANDGQNDGPVATTTISINPTNSAPILDPLATITLGEVEEDAVQPAGAILSAVLASGGNPITDIDSGAFEGIAVLGVETVNGQWQYSTTNPPSGQESWLPIGTVSETAALLLSDTSWLRFVPAANYHGVSGVLTFRAWDRTSGSNGQLGVNVSINGGSTPFSTATNTISVIVTPVNDLPAIGGIPTTPLQFVEDAGPLPLPGNSLTVTDLDSPLLASATVRLTNPMDGDAEWLLVTTEGTGISQAYEDGVLQLTGAAPPATYQTVLRSVEYWNASQDPDPTDRIFQISVADNQGSSSPVNLIVQVQPVNDPPELDLNGVGPGEDFLTTFFINRGFVPIVATSLTVNDIDNTTIKSATVRIENLKNKDAETLSADLTGVTNIKRTYDPATGELTLVGVDSIANYQRVLRTVSYNNILPVPDMTQRTIKFVLNDGVNTSQVRQTLLSITPPANVFLYAPVISWAYHRVEEPNDTCGEAMGIGINVDEAFLPDDKDDWFFFDLASAAEVTVELRDFSPREGQIIVAAEKKPGQGCGGLELIANNGSNATNKTVSIGQRSTGRYYIWIINDGAFTTSALYKIHVRVVP